MSRYTVAIGLAIEGAALVFALSLCRAARRADQQRAGHHAELQVRAEPLAVASQHALGCPRTGLDAGAYTSILVSTTPPRSVGCQRSRAHSPWPPQQRKRSPRPVHALRTRCHYAGAVPGAPCRLQQKVDGVAGPLPAVWHLDTRLSAQHAALAASRTR